MNKYTFNYWHPYAQDKYIALAEGDSTFTVWDEISAFNIDTIAYNPVKRLSDIDVTTGVMSNDGNGSYGVIDQSTVDIAYGFNPANAKSGNKERIPGLAQLVRTAYKVSLNGSEWKVNQNDQFNNGKNSWAYGANENAGVQKYDEYIAFFKENMHVDGQHYYAILKANNTKASVLVDVKDNAGNVLYKEYVDKYTYNNDLEAYTNSRCIRLRW